MPPLPELTSRPRRQPKPDPKPDPLNYVVVDGGEARVRTRASLNEGTNTCCGRFDCTNPLPEGTECAVVEEVTWNGTARCRLTRPVKGWVNLTDLVPLAGADHAPVGA